jgi:hypothetical protein
MANKESPLSAAVKGAAAGLVGTAVMTAAMKYIPPLLRELGLSSPEPPASARSGKPVEKLAGKVAEGVFDRRLDKEGKEIGGQVIHWGYGAGWGAFYGVVQRTLRLPFLVHGSLLGVMMAVAASTLVPAMKVAPAADKVPTSQKVLQTSFIMMHAWTTALVYHFLSED